MENGMMGYVSSAAENGLIYGKLQSTSATR